MKKLLFIITLFITTISAQVLENSVPMNLSFQGVLSSSDGTIYEDGEYDLTFRIMFPSLQGVEINIWQETQSVFVANGLFSTVLGSIEELPAIIPGNAELEVQVGEEVLTPRTTFTSVPFSIASNFAAISGRAQVADSSNYSTRADSSMFSMHSQHAIYADTAMVAMSAPMAGSAMYAGYSDTSGFSYQSTHSTYSDSSMYSGSAGQAIHANYATQSDTSVYSYSSMVSVYADTAVFVGESIHSIYSDSSLVSMNAMSSIYADTAYYVLGYTPTSELGVVALSNDFNDLLNIPDYVLPGDITGITLDQSAAIELNTAKVGITSGQASAIVANTSKVGFTDDLVAANSAVAANTAKVSITTDQASAIIANTAKVSGATNINGLSDA
ncbi:hypothetical protein HOD84_07225, partial [bacterium]|nr:hypothetical protein [bacterium]